MLLNRVYYLVFVNHPVCVGDGETNKAVNQPEPKVLECFSPPSDLLDDDYEDAQKNCNSNGKE